ncbi:MAG: hypothetical protein J6O50_07650 [Ruminiclostridium sp.]|nr:hypothetical protein [Ruminiclostridium sp.]
MQTNKELKAKTAGITDQNELVKMANIGSRLSAMLSPLRTSRGNRARKTSPVFRLSG